MVSKQSFAMSWENAQVRNSEEQKSILQLAELYWTGKMVMKIVCMNSEHISKEVFKICEIDFDAQHKTTSVCFC